ncbi:MAG: DMT family transporter [Sphaerochaetaceae bacterium]|jgi:drug/metabolite transporter (DMT)-like permease
MNKTYKGIAAIIISAFCFATMNVFVRLAGDIPSIQKSFFRNFVAMIVAAGILIRNKESFHWGKGNFPLLVLRSFAGTVGILCNFYAVDHLVLSDASMLNKLSPFFAILFSLLFLRERISILQALCVAGAFIGSLFIVKPTFANADLSASLIGLLGGIGAGAAYTCVRALGGRGERGSLIVFFFSSFSCLITLPWLLLDHAPMTFGQIGLLLCAGLSATGGQFAITAAYTYAPAREISVYDYSQVIFSALLGLIIFGQRPDLSSIAGYVIICAMAIIMFSHDSSPSRKAGQ